jgi:hypothetical protein
MTERLKYLAILLSIGTWYWRVNNTGAVCIAALFHKRCEFEPRRPRYGVVEGRADDWPPRSTASQFACSPGGVALGLYSVPRCVLCLATRIYGTVPLSPDAVPGRLPLHRPAGALPQFGGDTVVTVAQSEEA